MKIGVFDSGVGGLSVARAIEKAVPEHEVILLQDKEHIPYGSKTPDQLLALVLPFMQQFKEAGCAVVVIACNTVTTTIINDLRNAVDVPLVAVEPMLKPATELTKTKVIAVCATPTTLKSERYNWLKQAYAGSLKVIEPDCSTWALMIEHSQIEAVKINNSIKPALEAGADVIVLACTHYHWIEEEITKLAGNQATVIQPEQALIRQLKIVLERLA